MSVTFDAAAKRIVLNPGVTSVTAQVLYSRWKEWARLNPQYDPAFRVVGGDPIGGGLFVASYFFLTNGWRVRPFEGNHTLVIAGNLVVDGGGVPVVNTLGSFNVSNQFTVPVQAQGISTSGGAGMTTEQATQLAELWKLHGLDATAPLNVTPTSRQAGAISQAIIGDGKTSSTVTRV